MGTMAEFIARQVALEIECLGRIYSRSPIAEIGRNDGE